MAQNEASIDLFDQTDEEGLDIVATYAEWEDHITDSMHRRTHVVIHTDNKIITTQVADYERTEGNRLIHLTNATINGNPVKQKLDLTFTQITKLYPFGDKTPPLSVSQDDHDSFEVLNISYHNDQLSQVIANRAEEERNHQTLLDSYQNQWQDEEFENRVRSSTPTNWADSNEPELALSPVPSVETPTPPVRINTTMSSRRLPLLSDNKTVDEEYLRLIWQIERPDITFPMWCGLMNITSEMEKCKFVFGQSLHKTRLAKENPKERKRLFNSWKNTFQSHFQTFDEWYKPELEIIKTKPYILTSAYFMDLKQLHTEAQDHILNITDQSQVQHLIPDYYTWSHTLIRKHNLHFTDWLTSEKPKSSERNAMPQTATTLTQTPTLQPFLQLLEMNDQQLFDDYNQLHDYIIDPSDNSRLNMDRTLPTQDQFHPEGLLSNLHVPQYTHVPYGVLPTMKLNDLRKKTHIKHIIWSRLKTVQNSAFINNKPAYDKFVDTDKYNHLSPFIRAYRSQIIKRQKIEPALTSLHITQHINAHLWLKHEGGLQNITAHAFYDMFIRPLEFLITRGMTLHHQMVLACHNYIERHNLFRNIIEMAGFQITDPIPADVHMVFQELTRVRHLDPYALIDVSEHVTNPFHLLDAIPLTPDRPSRIPTPQINPEDFSETGIYKNFKPSLMTPLPNKILNLFPNLSGTNISFSDHMRLHQEMCKQYNTHLKQQRLASHTSNKFNTRYVTPHVSFSEVVHTDTQEQQQLHLPQAEARKVYPTPTPPPRLNRPTPQSATGEESMSMIAHSIKEYKDKQIQQLQREQQQQKVQSRRQSKQHQQFTQEEEQISTPTDQLLTLNQFQTMQQFQAQATQKANKIKQIPEITILNRPTNQQGQPQHGLLQLQQQSELPSLLVPQITRINLDGAAENNVEFFKPDWILNQRHEEKQRQILIGEVLWTASSHERTPQTARESHSAKSISERLVKNVHLNNHARYKTITYYRQFPVDGAISHHTAKIGYLEDRHPGEQIYVEIETLQEVTTKKYAPLSQAIVFPPHIFHRFISVLHECSDITLAPRVHDVTQQNDHLLNKSFRVANFLLVIDVKVVRNKDKSDRFTFIRVINQQEPSIFPNAEISFPWFQTYEVVAACKSLHSELIENHLL